MASSAIRDNPRPSPSVARFRPLRWMVAVAIVFLLFAATLLLFALSSTKERSEAREEVVADTLLARESIRFQIGREIEALQQIAAGISRRSLLADGVDGRLRVFLRRAGEAEGVTLVDETLRPLVFARREGARTGVLAQVPAEMTEATVARARMLGQPTFSAAFQAERGASLALVVPVPEPGNLPRLFLVSVHSLDHLLEEMVPWNLAQEYAFTLGDVTGTAHARRASVGPGRGVYTHQVPLELPGSTLVLGLNSVKGAPDWIANALRAGIATLAALLLWSLWALWRDHERRMAAEQLAGEEAAFRRAMGDCAVIGLTASDMEGRVTYVNPAFCEMVGRREEELVGQAPMHPYWMPELHDESRRRTDGMLNGRSAKAAYETELTRRNGEHFPAAIYDAPLLNADGRQVGWTSSIVDLTEQKHAAERERLQQERLQTAARLTTMGEMASSLAHELNQPLGAIASYVTGSLNMLERGDADRSEIVTALGKASAQTQRAGEVIRRVHEFVRKHEPRRVPVDLEALVEDCRPLIELQARRAGVQVHAIIDAGLPALNGDPVMLQQVVLNLTRNAIDAMADVPQERRRLVIAAARDAAGVRLSVRDFGIGIPAEDSERIFTPFYTTRPEGMGMGLSICRTIVQAHNGRLWFEREEPGTSFHLWVAAA
jgi:two-component system sensor histidine kinase DctS